MKFILQLLLIMVLGFFLGYFIVWWGVAIAAFIGGVLLANRASFWAGFLGTGLLWFIGAEWIAGTAATGFVDQVAAIFKVSPWILFVIAPFLGALVGGFAALSGSLLRSRRTESNPYRL